MNQAQKKGCKTHHCGLHPNDDKTLKYELSASEVKQVNFSSGHIASHGQSTNDKFKSNLMNHAVTLDSGYSVSPLRMGFPHKFQLPSVSIVGKDTFRVDKIELVRATTHSHKRTH